MERSKSQILFNFLQDDTFDHAHNGSIGRVKKIRRDIESDTLPKGYVIQRIRSKLSDWENNPTFNVPDTQIVKPRSVEFEVFPRTFECSNCEKLSHFTKNDFQKFQNSTKSRLTCDNSHCDRKLTARDQLQFVKVCKCGRLESLWVPKSGEWELQRRDTLASSLLRNVSGETRPLRTLGGPCFDCDAPRNEQEIKVHSASSSFYPQQETFVNAEREDIQLIRKNSKYRESIIVDYVSEDPNETALSPEEELDSVIQSAVLDKLDDSTKQQVEDAKTQVRKEKEKVREEAERFINQRFEENQLISIGEELFELDQIRSDSEDADIYAHSLEDLAERAQNPDTIYQPEKVQSFLKYRNELGVDELRLMENFPITTAVYGYSRLNYEPIEGTYLNTFTGKHGKEIYAQTAEAEAVQVTLDPNVVLSWLKSQPFLDLSEAEGLDDEYQLRRWFLEQLSPLGDENVIPYFDDVPPSHPVRHAVISLIHSYAHTFINAIDALSGYSKESLVEYILPRPLSFIIYKRSDTDFNLGAVFTLIEDRFDEVYNQILSEGQDCIYDPICKKEDGHACEGCLYVSNLSCQYRNHSLSRAPLYGGRYDDRNFTGYLDAAKSYHQE